jgi:ubiquinone biosynthesis protein UbiJ
MATQSPFPFVDELLGKLAGGLQPPAWMVAEIQRRVVLSVNHVLMQEPEAQARLARHANRVVEARWRNFVMRVITTPAGLMDVAPAAALPDLTLTLTQESPFQLAQAALRGDKTPVRIAGDVQFAAEINWLVENVRWDLEEDLSRLIGDAPAHALGEGARAMVQGLRQFAGQWAPATATATATATAPAAQPPAPGSGQGGA